MRPLIVGCWIYVFGIIHGGVRSKSQRRTGGAPTRPISGDHGRSQRACVTIHNHETRQFDTNPLKDPERNRLRTDGDRTEKNRTSTPYTPVALAVVPLSNMPDGYFFLGPRHTSLLTATPSTAGRALSESTHNSMKSRRAHGELNLTFG